MDIVNAPHLGSCLSFDVLTARGDAGTAAGWQPWRKPPQARMIFILALGAGAGGGD